ncbi:MAG: cobalamin-dependent protein [Candidatus Riflebacteria bacterium]|nr:cobalamin-dependent protein [Candidatus Riflebacteria bacterium]
MVLPTTPYPFESTPEGELIISETLYLEYFKALSTGNIELCTQIVRELLENDIEIKNLYQSLFQRSLYQIGQMWEMNLCSVSVEHLATAITERMFSLVYPRIFFGYPKEKKVVISCIQGELHQIGARMVADIFEINKWDAIFLGANTPTDDLFNFISSKRPNAVGLSMSIYFHFPVLLEIIEKLYNNFPTLTIFVGGQGLKQTSSLDFGKNTGIIYLESLEKLEEHLK